MAKLEQTMSKQKYTLLIISASRRIHQTHTERSRRALPGQRRKPSRRRPYLTVVPGICRICGCTEAFACKGGCSWIDEERTLCNRCEEKGL